MSESARSRNLPPSSATSHGKIHTENPELLTLLREKTRDNLTASNQSPKHASATERKRTPSPASAEQRFVDQNIHQNLHAASPAQNLLDCDTNVSVRSASHNSVTDQDKDNFSDIKETSVLIPPLNLESNREEEFHLNVENINTESEQLFSDTDATGTQSGEQRNKLLHDLVSKTPTNPEQIEDLHDYNLHETPRANVSSALSQKVVHANTPALSSRSVALNGEGSTPNSANKKYSDKQDNIKESQRHNTDSVVLENKNPDLLNEVNTDRSYKVVSSSVNESERELTRQSLELDPNLYAYQTPGQSAPVTGRQTYNVPSPVSTHIPNIDSLSHFSNPDEKQSRPGSRKRSGKQRNFASSKNIPTPGQGVTSPRQSATTTRLLTSRDPSATQRSSSSVYAVANPAVLVAQGITPAPNQQTVQFTPRPKQSSRQKSLIDSLEVETKETQPIKRSDIKSREGRKSAVSFKDQKEEKSVHKTQSESPEPVSDPDWGSPSVKDRVPTPHPTSPIKKGYSPDPPVWETEEEERKNSRQSLKEQELDFDENKPEFDRGETPFLSSPTPLGEHERKLESAAIKSLSAKSGKRVVRTDSLPTVKRVYIDSPTFTKEEEDEYRFVESRLADIQDDVEETLRKLDKETEKQRQIRKQLEDQRAKMYAPAYEDQRNDQRNGGYSQMYNDGNDRGYQAEQNYRNGGDRNDQYGRNAQHSEPYRENMGSYTSLRYQDDSRLYGDSRKDTGNMRGSEVNRDNMGSYSMLQNGDRNSYQEPRRDNMGSYTSVRDGDRNSYGDPRRENMGSYASLRHDDRNSYEQSRKENIGSYTSVRTEDRNSYGEPRKDNMGSYASLRYDDRNSYNEQRRDDRGPHSNSQNDNSRNTYEEQREAINNRDQRINDRQFNDRNANYNQYERQNVGRGNTRSEPPQQDNSLGYGGVRREDDRYEDRDFDRYGDRDQNNPPDNRNQYDDQDQQPESERYEMPPLLNGLNGNYETHDEELKREAEYQEGLRTRVHESGKRDMEIQIPRIPIPDESFRDSLEEEGYREWKNPPPNPFANEGGGPQSNRQFEEPPEERKPSFVDENDTARMEFIHPKSPKYDFIEMNKMDYGKPHERTYRELKHVKEEESRKLQKAFIQPKLPPKKKHAKPGAKSAPGKFQINSPIEEIDPNDPAQALWAKRSAQLQKKEKKTASGTVNKSKGLQRFPSDSRLVRQPLQGGGPFSHPNPHQGLMYGTPTRNHFLEPMENRPPPPPAPRSDPANMSQYATRSEPANFPERYNENLSPPLRPRPLDLKPITQEIVTEDGQRISVDINLKVLSPPPGSGNEMPTVHAEVHPKDQSRRPTGMQYQMDNVERQQEQQQTYNQDSNPPYSNVYNDGYGNQENVPPANDTSQPVDATHRYDSQGMSPYQKVPPINLTEEELDRQLEEMGGLGYAAMYKQAKNKPTGEKPWYQVYTLNDYRKMKNELNLNRAPLGPDLDNETYKEKLEKRHKQFEYARMVMEKNRQELEGKKPSQPRKKEDEKEHNKRKTALEYSKNIPKPQVRPRPNQYNSYEVAAQLSPVGKKNASPVSQSPTQTVDVIDLKKLKQRHDQEKQNVAMIRQNMESVPQKA